MSGFDTIHAALRALMLEAAPGHTVVRDGPGDLVLHAPHRDAETREPVWFGAVTTKKSYVAFHLFPIYADPSLAEDISPELNKRRQGKSCFNFKQVDADLFTELAALTRKAAGRTG